jgi:hypothetical protein
MSKRRDKSLQGWTLSETLIVMIVAGIVFLAVMDGMVLFGRYASRKTGQITGNMRLYEGYYLLRHIAAEADSVAAAGNPVWEFSAAGGGVGSGGGTGSRRITLFREGRAMAELIETDSLLIARRISRIDTLIAGVSGLALIEARDITGADTLKLTVRIPEGDPLMLSFPVVPATDRLAIKTIEEREKQYIYE